MCLIVYRYFVPTAYIFLIKRYIKVLGKEREYFQKYYEKIKCTQNFCHVLNFVYYIQSGFQLSVENNSIDNHFALNLVLVLL